MPKIIRWDEEESQLLNELEGKEWQSKPLSSAEMAHYQNSAQYTKSLQQKNKQPYALH